MALLSSLKSLLGLADDAPSATVSQQSTELEPATESELAVKAPVSNHESQHGTSPIEPIDSDHHRVDAIAGIGPTYRERLAAAGITSVDELAGADVATVAAECDIGKGRVAQWVERAKDG